MTKWHFIAQRALTGEFLDFDVPLKMDGLSWALSGAGSLTGTITPDVGRLRGGDGRLVLEKWGTLIYAEADGVIRWGGIVIDSSFTGEEWKVEAAGFATYPHGLTYDTAYSRTSVDPADVFVELWLNAQWRGNARLGVHVVADRTPVRIGEPGYSTLKRPTVADNLIFTRRAISGVWEAEPSPPAGVNPLLPHPTYGTVFGVVYDTDVPSAQWRILRDFQGWRFMPNGSQHILYPPWTLFGVQMSAADRDQALAVGYIADPRAGDAGALIPPIIARPVGADGHYPINAVVTQFKDTADNDTWKGVRNGTGYMPATAEFQTIMLSAADDVDVVQTAPYTLFWWESPGIGDAIDNLAKATPFDYVEKHFWVPKPGTAFTWGMDPDLTAWLLAHGWTVSPDDPNLLVNPSQSTGDEIAHVVRLAYPRVGSKRRDLTFEQGVNISQPVAADLSGDDYANAVLGVGAGEGVASLRREVGVDDGRLRRESVYTDKSVKDPTLMDAHLRYELAWRSNDVEITSVTVADHAHARIGSWQVGDDVLVEANLPWLGRVSVWSRITGWTLVSDDTATLTLVRSDSFSSGGPNG